MDVYRQYHLPGRALAQQCLDRGRGVKAGGAPAAQEKPETQEEHPAGTEETMGGAWEGQAGRQVLAGMGLAPTPQQRGFMETDADEVLFGGAAGGGKSMAQLMDALVYAVDQPGSRQLLLRRTFPELEKSLIRTALAWYPQGLFRYSGERHSMTFLNGSVLDFGHCQAENDVYKYQSAEYDMIRFDELTHFTRWMYLYLHSRLRGTAQRPRQVKSCTNPGGEGHSWVKKRFVDGGPPGTLLRGAGGGRVFLPSRLQDNPHLQKADPGYEKRLLNLPLRERRALLYGDWEIAAGQYFPEFAPASHVVGAFAIPPGWRVYRTLDYGLDMLACYWVAVDPGAGEPGAPGSGRPLGSAEGRPLGSAEGRPLGSAEGRPLGSAEGRCYVFKEVFRAGLVISEAAGRILEAEEEMEGPSPALCTFAPPDLWNRRQETGRSAADIFAQHGVPLTRVSNQRVQGWLDLKEYLRVREEGPVMRLFDTCPRLAESLQALPASAHNPGDAATMPHEFTHGPDALRYFAAGRPPLGREAEDEAAAHFEDQVAALLDYGV